MGAPSGREPARRLASLALLSLALFVALVIALHLLRPDCDPRSRHLSEYAVGEDGWRMTVAFVAAAIALAALAIALGRSLAPSRPLVVGSRLLLLAAALNGAMAVFRTDLSIAVAGVGMVRTASGRIHDALAAAHALVWLVAPILVTAAIRRDPDARPFARASLLATSAELILLFTLAALHPVLPGIGQRLWVAAMVGWCAGHAVIVRRVG